MTVRLLALVACIVIAAAAPVPGARADSKVVILTTTTSVQDSGLLDRLVPMFERATGLTVKTIAVGTGQALALAARGEADVTLAHAPDLEKTYVLKGGLRNRRPVMANDFVILGPPADPAGIAGQGAVEGLRRIAAAGARFVSRGDHSGTHGRELALWREAGVRPAGAWYIETGQGMGATLGIAADRGAYTLGDRGTWLAYGTRLSLAVLVEGDRALINAYSVLEVNPANGSRVNAAGGRAFADFLVGPETQRVIGEFGVARFCRPLFIPAAGRSEAELGR